METPKNEPWSFCETPEEKCTMNYCDDNGCQNRKRVLVSEEIPNPTAQLKADKAELLEALKKISKVTDEGYIYDDTDFEVWESELKQVHGEIESLIQKMKQ